MEYVEFIGTGDLCSGVYLTTFGVCVLLRVNVIYGESYYRDALSKVFGFPMCTGCHCGVIISDIAMWVGF